MNGDMLVYLERGGVLGLLALFIFALSRQILVWGWQYKEVSQRETEWKHRYFQHLDEAETLLGLKEQS